MRRDAKRIIYLSFFLEVLFSMGLLHAQQIPNMVINRYGETMGGAPSLGSVRNNSGYDSANETLYIAFRANDPSNILWIDSTQDGTTNSGAIAFPQVHLGSDPTIVGSNADNVLLVAFSDWNTETLNVCSISAPITQNSTVNCTNFPSIHVVNTPFIFTPPNGTGVFWVAFNTINGNPAVAEIVNGNSILRSIQLSDYAATPPAITGLINNNFFLLSFQNGSTHQLEVRTLSYSNLQIVASNTLPQLVGGTPAATPGVGGFVMAFQANDPGNRLWYSTIQNDLTSAQTASSPATIGNVPAIHSWYVSGQLQITVAFQANDSGHGLWFGTQPAQ